MPLLILLLLFAGIFFLSQWLIRHRAAHTISYHIAFSQDEATAGDTVTLTETIRSHTWIPIPWVKAELTTHAALQFSEAFSSVSEETRFLSSFFYLPPYRQIERRWRVTCTQRGMFRIDHAILVISDVFGTLEHSIAMPDAHAEIRVLPDVLKNIPELPTPLAHFGERLRKLCVIPDRTAFLDARPYRQGDSLRDVAWTMSARTEQLMVKCYPDTAAEHVTVLLCMETRQTDRDCVSDKAALEQAIRICSTCFAAAAAEQIPIRFAANTEITDMPCVTAIGCGTAHATALRRTLAAIPYRITLPFGTFLRKDMRTDSGAQVIVTAYVSAALRQYAAEHPNVMILSCREWNK